MQVDRPHKQALRPKKPGKLPSSSHPRPLVKSSPRQSRMPGLNPLSRSRRPLRGPFLGWRLTPGSQTATLPNLQQASTCSKPLPPYLAPSPPFTFGSPTPYPIIPTL